MSQCEHLISENIKRWETSLINELRLPTTRQELRLKAAQMDREAYAQGNNELRSLIKFAFALGSVSVVAFGVILLALG